MKSGLLILLCGLQLMIITQSIFSSEPVANFTVTKIDPAHNIWGQNYAVDSTKTKIARLISIDNSTELEIYTINGTLQCAQIISRQFSTYQFYWPPYANFSPIIQSFATYSIINESTCEVVQTFKFDDIWNITNNPQQIHVLASHLIFRNTRPTVVLIGYKGIYQVDMMTSKVVSWFLTNNLTYSFIASNLYSKNLSYTFAYTLPNPFVNANFTVRIWDLYSKYSLRDVYFNQSECRFVGSSNESIYFTSNSDYLANSTIRSLYKIFTNGSFEQKLPLKSFKEFTGPFEGVNGIISDTDLFDSVFNYTWGQSNNLELLNLQTGESVQNLSIPFPYALQSYKNRALLVRSQDKILIYKYMKDKVSPIPDDNGNDSTEWIIFICVLVAVLVIAGAVFFFIRKKKLAQKSIGIYGKLNDQV